MIRCVLLRAGIEGSWRVKRIINIDTVWSLGENVRVPYGQKGVDGESKGVQVRGRPRLGWMDGVKMALGSRGMTVEAARQCAKDRKEWRALEHM